MPLLDHFHPPVSVRKGWEGFNNFWASMLVQRLNTEILPRRYESEQRARLGSQLEIDAAAFEEEHPRPAFAANGAGAGAATAVTAYAPPVPPITGFVSFADQDVFEVRVEKDEGGWRLVAAVELVSPANKDRPSHRRAFATKCAAYLQAGVSVVVIDMVTDRAASLHDELIDRLDLPESFIWRTATGLSAICYRGLGTDRGERLDVWPFELRLGADLPTVPLWLAADLAVPLELELTYAAACKSLRLA